MSFRFINCLFSGKARLAVLNLGAAVRDGDILAVIGAQNGGIGEGFAVCGIFDDSGKRYLFAFASGNIPDIHGKQAGFDVEVVLGVFAVY